MKELYSQTFPAQSSTQHPPLAILHGLFGSGRNWLNIAKELSDQRTVWLVDQRNHGKSPHQAEMNLDLLSQDLLDWRQHKDLPTLSLIGHSLGGQVAMAYALRYYPSHLSHLIIVDVAPKAYDPRRFDFVMALKDLDLAHLQSRAEADQRLEQAIPDRETRQFLLTNLVRSEDQQFAWQMNLGAIIAQLKELSQSPLRLFEEEPEPFQECPVLFIRGGRSDYIQPSDERLILKHFPEAEMITVPEAGHWVHYQQPAAFVQIVRDFLKS
ncbi:MAG: alpha/beta fold hydrolase [Candidatus Sericytochromatia bacterium]